MAFNAFDMLPNENVELTVQHLDMLACCDVLSDKSKAVCDNASVYLRKMVLEEKNVEAMNPITDPKLGIFFGRCPKCMKGIRAIEHPHFCGHCGCHVEWEGWEEGS